MSAVSNEVLFVAVAAAVQEGLLPANAPIEEYEANVEKVRRIIEAAFAARATGKD